MRRVTIDGLSSDLSRVGFGTSRLFNSSAAHRQRLLHAAYEGNITHFDTSPLYGFGIAETELRSVARRSGVTIATKVGLYPPGGSDQHGYSVFLRKFAGKIFPSISKPVVDWTVEHARRSLDASLRRLGRDYVDLLLLHEPDPSLIATTEFLSWLQSEQNRARTFGIAGVSSRVTQLLVAKSPFSRVIQCSDSIENREADVVLGTGRKLQITYGYFAAARRVQPADMTRILSEALRRNANGCILFSSSREARIRQVVELTERFDGKHDTSRQ